MFISNIKQKASQFSKLINFLAQILIWVVVVGLAVLLGYNDVRTFHFMVEIFIAIVAFSAFIIALNTYSISQNNFLTFLSIAFGFVSLFEILHALTYGSMGIFQLQDPNMDLVISIIPRLLQSSALLISFVYIKKSLNITFSVVAYCLIAIALIFGMFYTGSNFAGYTASIDFAILFKSIELTVTLFFTIALILLFINRKNLKFRVFKYMVFSMLASITADALLVYDANMHSMINIWSHISKFIAFYCIYKAVIQNTLRNPVDSMFYELNMMKNELAEKNYEISRSNEKLKHDIEDLHLVEKLLRKSKAWSRSIFEGSPIGIALLNTNSVVIEVNPALERILGYDANELRNIGISNITHIDDIEKDSILFDNLIESNIDSYKIEKRYIRKDNKVIWANVKMSYIQNVGEDFQFIIAMIEDITQQKENDERQEQLVARLEETNKELDNFAYIVSHDLKAPLRGIGSLANWLVTDYKDKLDEEGAEIIDLLINRVERMKNFIDGILQYSRVSRVRDNDVDVDLNKLVRDVIEMIAPPPNINIKVQSELPVIKGEKLYMEQVFQNLLSNAIKFMDKPEGKIRIGCRAVGDFWEFSIKDNGSGIDEKYFNKIFMIFQTLQPRDKFESTGVGLSIVKKIIETSGGKIWLESELKKGTTFYFTLPRNK